MQSTNQQDFAYFFYRLRSSNPAIATFRFINALDDSYGRFIKSNYHSHQNGEVQRMYEDYEDPKCYYRLSFSQKPHFKSRQFR